MTSSSSRKRRPNDGLDGRPRLCRSRYDADRADRSGAELREDATTFHNCVTDAARIGGGILTCMDFMHFAGRTLVAFVVLLFVVARPAASQAPPQPATAHSSWFAPHLVIDRDPICVRLLPVVRQKFATDAQRYVWNNGNSPKDFGPLNFVPSRVYRERRWPTPASSTTNTPAVTWKCGASASICGA